MDNHEVKDRKMMEQSVELVANIGSVRIRGERSYLLPVLVLSSVLRCFLQMLNKRVYWN